jgi:tryptophanyl-tRNA synthetase
MQTSGLMHLGNYHGAVENWVSLQDGYECFFFCADLHALTVFYGDSTEVVPNTLDIATNLLAAGIDPNRSVLFLQSLVHEHCELFAVLSMMTPLGWLERVPTFKEKIEQVEAVDLHTHGFLGYPVLQTADIILYNAHYVPVGEDQVAHLELAREITRKFHFHHGELFVEPQPLLTRFSKLPGLDGRKMSKSYNNAIYLADDDETVRKKVMNAVTDPQRQRRTDPGRPEVCNIHQYYKVYAASERVAEIGADCRTAKIGCVDCKKELFGLMLEKLGPVRARRTELAQKPGYVIDVLVEGSRRASVVAADTMRRVRERMKMTITPSPPVPLPVGEGGS